MCASRTVNCLGPGAALVVASDLGTNAAPDHKQA